MKSCHRFQRRIYVKRSIGVLKGSVKEGVYSTIEVITDIISIL